MNIKEIFKSIGPGPIVAAAFIGPGTVTVCTLAGVNWGYSLMWAMLISILITGFLQEASGRLGVITKKDLSEILRDSDLGILLKWFALPLVLLAIALGNAAYESGNLTGAALGLDVIINPTKVIPETFSIKPTNLLAGVLALALLWYGSFKTLQNVLTGLVIVLSVSFLVTAFMVLPEITTLAKGFIPRVNSENLLLIASIIGTTVVPYNLFLYASLAKKQWEAASEIGAMRKDIWISVVLGGIVSMAIIVVGASNPSTEINSVVDLSKGLELTLGKTAKYLTAIGLFGAGITSSITAPLATGLVVCGLFGWDQNISSKPMRWVMISTVSLGLIFSSFGITPVQLIVTAQLANGILLPLVSGWILWLSAQKGILGKYATRRSGLIFGVLIWLMTLALGIKSVSLVFA
ncbi:Nramp family divalent metal transporter [Algoriphagus sediminis]|uniref:Nramp family divalent metal transporter n=1 Tax=Algoriphagus sediminis TaxID=3057113 RepID=A0ABT7YDN1_9BACT|nr:Nramp family divalent metal transporter [Algoriphagus sediminis]MDN3204637.1 Nramp family divalent metal transporter [Algoriphagus sediminis]